MNIRVEKYGGSSLATLDHIEAVARKIISRFRSGGGLVVVVSAMGDTTDHLLSTAHKINKAPKERELGLLVSTGEIISASLLSMAIQKLGFKSTALTG